MNYITGIKCQASIAGWLYSYAGNRRSPRIVDPYREHASIGGSNQEARLSGTPGASCAAGGFSAEETARCRALQEHFKANFSAIFRKSGRAAHRRHRAEPQFRPRRDDAHRGRPTITRSACCACCCCCACRARGSSTSPARRSPESIIDYYLHLLPGIPGLHARTADADLLRRRVAGRSDAQDPRRPRLIERIRESIPDPASAHMTFLTVTEQKRLALALDLPIYGCDPRSPAGARRAARARFSGRLESNCRAASRICGDADAISRARWSS